VKSVLRTGLPKQWTATRTPEKEEPVIKVAKLLDLLGAPGVTRTRGTRLRNEL
jgi:hypothetical protein